MRIYLIGYSYGGKTTMGRQLAERMGYAFFDTDKAIELKYHVTIPVFFEHYGEKAFRIIERQILLSTADMDDVVVSTGGGLACNGENIKFILEHGVAVHMQMSLDDIMERIAISRKVRPMLAGMSVDEKRTFIGRQLSERQQYYSQAPLTLAALHATVDQLESLVRDYCERTEMM